MRVVLFPLKPFGQMSKANRLRARFLHCILRWLA